MKRTLWVLVATLLAALSLNPIASAFDPTSAASVFTRLAAAPELRNPSVSLIDVSTGEIIFESNANSQRKPASVMKLLAAVSTLKYLDPEKVFTTSVSLGFEPDSLVINGSYDPWMSMDSKVAKKMKRTAMYSLAAKGLSAVKESSGGSVKKMNVYYNEIYPIEVLRMKAYFKKYRVSTNFIKVTEVDALALAKQPVVISTSPPVKKMLNWFLLWSDNDLAERLARLAAKSAGNSFNEVGVKKTFTDVLEQMGIDASRLIIKDASGLSRENKVTTHVIALLLYKVYSDPVLSKLITDLPVSGVSGTLSERYIETAPNGVGLVRAKTGTLSGTVSIAGYVQSGDREYAFVIIADKISRTYSASERARKTFDRYLSKIAAPLVPLMVETSTAITDSQTPL